VTLPAFAAEHRAAAPMLLSHGAHCTTFAACPQLLIDISCLQGAQQQTRCTPLLLPIDGTDRRTDHPLPLCRPCSDTGSINMDETCWGTTVI